MDTFFQQHAARYLAKIFLVLMTVAVNPSHAQLPPINPGGIPPAAQATSVIALENAKPGTGSWKLDNPALAREIEGYASLTSINRGGSIDFLVNTAAASFNIEIYRMGYYGGSGARLLRSVANVAGRRQTVPCLNPNGVIECNWVTSHTLIVPNTTQDPVSPDYWASGVYLAKLSTNTTPRKDSYIIFVVRDDNRAATYISQLPVTAYQAYNYWGGKSLYTGCDNHDSWWNCYAGTPPATEISFNRPYGKSSNPAAAYGVGAGEFITNVQPVAQGMPFSSAGFDYNWVRWMEKQGYDVKYITNLDLHENTAVLNQAKAFVSGGHDEYFSKPMWDRLVNARSAGINLAFMSANQLFWQIRFRDGSYGAVKRNRNMICYRSGFGDPVTDNNLTTNQFRYLGRPEAALMGTQYGVAPILDSVTITNPAHWLFAGTGAVEGTALPGLLGYEINAVVPGITPSQTQVLAHSVSGGNLSDMTYYVDASSAQVFSTGTVQWSWGLDDFISNGTRQNYTSPIAQVMTANLFDALAERRLFTFTSLASGHAMTTPAGNLESAQVVQNPAPANNSKINQWRLVPSNEPNYYQIVSRATGLCLDAYGQDDGVPIGTWDCHGGDNQKWLMNDLGGGVFALMEKRTNRCIDVPAYSPNAGTGLELWGCHYGRNQQWRRAALP